METAESKKQSFREAAQAYDRTSKLFRELMKYKDDIAALRQKGASFDTIRELLQNDDVRVSWKTVSRFCRKVFGTERRRRRNAPSAQASDGAANGRQVEAGAASLLAALNEQRTKVLRPWTPRKRGPRIADSKNL